MTQSIFQNINSQSKTLFLFFQKICVKKFCSSSAFLESVSLANIIWYMAQGNPE
jgi:hypothetical protein